MFNALACRSEKQSIFKVGLFSNKMFNFAVGGSILSQLFVIYLPFFQNIFQTEALSLYDLILIACLTSSVFVVDEVKKYISSQGIYLAKGRGNGDKQKLFNYHVERQEHVDAAFDQV